MTREAFISLEQLGRLAIRDVFLTIEYPRIFICEDALQTKYLFYEIDSDFNFDSWLVLRISNNRYYGLLTRQIGIVSAFEQAEEMKFHFITHNYDTDETSHEVREGFDRNLIAVNDFYPERSVDSFNGQQLLQESMRMGSTLIDFRLFPNNHSIKDIEIGFLTSLCNKFKTLISALSPKKSFIPRVSTHSGSFIVRFNLNEKMDLFVDESATSTVSKIHQLLSAEERSDINFILNSSKSNIDNYKSLIKLLSSNETDLEISSATPLSSSVTRKYINVDRIRKTKDYLDNFYEVSQKEEKFIGTLIAVDTNKGKFSFKVDGQQELINGVIPKESIGTYEVPGRYTIVVILNEQVVTVNFDATTIKKEYILNAIEILN